MKILWTGEISDAIVERLQNLGCKLTIKGVDELIETDKFIKAIENHDIYVSGGLETLSAAVIDAANSLKLAIFLGADAAAYFDLDAARNNGVAVCNTPGANARSVAELTMGFAILASRKIMLFTKSLKASDWNPNTTHTLYGSEVFLVGMGNIATHFARSIQRSLYRSLRSCAPCHQL